MPQGEDHSHVDSHADEMNEIDGEFGFVTLDRTHTLTSFEAYAKWAKALHFGLPYDKARPSILVILVPSRAVSLNKISCTHARKQILRASCHRQSCELQFLDLVRVLVRHLSMYLTSDSLLN